MIHSHTYCTILHNLIFFMLLQKAREYPELQMNNEQKPFIVALQEAHYR